MPRRNFEAIKKQHDSLLLKYGNDFEFRGSGYEWVPPHLITTKSGIRKGGVKFWVLEKEMKMDHWYPYYDLSSDSIHGGARGFHRLGLRKQGKVLLVGPSDYGLTNPLQNTSIALHQMTASLLSLKPTIDDLIFIDIMKSYSHQVGLSAVEAMKAIERD